MGVVIYVYSFVLPYLPCCFSDTDKILDGIGEKFSFLIQWIATFFVGFIVAFVRDWHLTLFMLVIAPIIAIVAGILSKVCLYKEQG